LSEAVLKQYKPESMMTDEELEQARKKEQAELYINTQKGGVKKI
jgi:hypothetical protein